MRRFVVVALVLALSVIIAATGAVAGAGTVAAGQAERPVTVTIGGENTVSPGDTTTVAVKINSSVEVYAAQFTLVVKPKSVDIASSSRGRYLSRNGSSLVVANDINRSNMTYGETRIKSDWGVAGAGTLATASLTVPGNSENISFYLTDVSVVDPSIESLPARVENHTIAVRSANDGANTTQPSESANDGDTSGSNDGSAADTRSTDDGDLSGSDHTGSSDSSLETTPPGWHSKVDQRVIDATDDTGASPVLIEVQSLRSTRLGQTAARLNESGLRNATLNRKLQIVRGTVENDSLPRLANVTGVERIRYDLSVEQQSSLTTPYELSTDETTVTGSPERASATETVASRGTATSTGGPGFTAPLALVGAAVSLLLMRRQASL